jgi:hypothetical protein
VWIAAFTEESGIELDGNRRAKQWQRPQPFAPGWVQGPTVWVPRIDGKHDLPASLPSKPQTIVWVPTPEIGNVAVITLLIAERPDAEPADLDPSKTVVGDLSLTNGERVWVVAFERQIDDVLRKHFLQLRDQELGIGALKGPKFIRRGVDCGSLLHFGSSTDGLPSVTQIASGSHNYEAPLVD